MPSATLFIDRLIQSSIQGGVFALVVWLSLRFVPVVKKHCGDWIWLVVLAKFGLSLLGSLSLPVLPAKVGSLGTVDLPAEASVLDAAALQQPGTDFPTVLCLLWAAGFFVVVAKTVAAHGRIAKTVRQSVPAPAWVMELAEGLDVRVHSESSVPFVAGLWKPAVVLPAPFLDTLSKDELAMILAHETAHIRRKDLLAGAFAFVCHAPFYFHPCAWLARREWQLSGESECDRIAIEQTNACRRAYAAMLVKISAGRAPIYAMSAVPAVKTLRRRIENMKNQNKPLSKTGTLVALAVAAAAALPLVFVPRAQAQEKPSTFVVIPDKPNQKDLDNYRDMLRKMVDEGKITQAQAESRFKAFRDEAAAKYSIESDLSAYIRELERQVKAGKLTQAQAKQLIKKRLDEAKVRQRQTEIDLAEEKLRRLVAGGQISEAEAKAKLDALRQKQDSALVKSDFEKVAVDLQRMVEAGKISKEEAARKLEDMRRDLERTVPPRP